jgi:hypothetical protein
MQDASATVTKPVSGCHAISVLTRFTGATVNDTKGYLAAGCNRPSVDMVNATMWLDGTNSKVSDSVEPRRQYCGQAGFGTPCGYEV